MNNNETQPTETKMDKIAEELTKLLHDIEVLPFTYEKICKEEISMRILSILREARTE